MELGDLIQGCMKNDRASQKLLYQKYYGYAMSICLRYANSHDDAVEVLNDGFMKVFVKIQQYDANRSFKGWLRKTLINTAIDQFRKQAKHHHNDDMEAAQGVAADGDAISDLSHEEIITLVQKLPKAYRTVFNLYAIDGYKHHEIAEMLDITIGTSKSNLSKARAKLQEQLKKLHQVNLHNYV